VRGLRNHVCVVTGAGQGIGRGIARRLVEEGAIVVAAGRGREAGEAVVAELAATGGEAWFQPTDVRDEADCARLVAAVEGRHGRLDVLVNNAGVGLLRSVVDTTADEYAYVMDTNVRGAFMLCKHALPGMVARKGGSIVNLASVASFVGFEHDAAYCASKGALLMLTRQLALEYAPRGVRVNAVCPGFVDTPELRHYCGQQADPVAALAVCEELHPLGRVGEPEEIAAAVAFLASAESSFVTGAALVVDGGLLTR